MKAISIQQPWAWAILHAGKDIENRSWSTDYRGDIAVHATRLQPVWSLPPGVAPPAPRDLVLGSVLGVVEIVDVVARSNSRWFTGPLGFVLRNPRPLRRPIRCGGNLRLWSLPASVEKIVREDVVTRAVTLPGVSWADLKKQRPRAGARWTAAEDAQMLDELKQGVPLEAIAAHLRRGPFSVQVRLAKLGKPMPARELAVNSGGTTRRLTVTQANLDHNHLYLTEAMDLFPADVLGGTNASQAGRPVRVLWGDQVIESDVVAARKIFRAGGWLRRFFAANHVRAGDQVLLEKLKVDVYRVSKAER